MINFTAIDKHTFGSWAIVTGASSGIGAEFARQLAGSGINLILIARRLNLLEALGRDLQATYGIQYRTLGLDLTDKDFLSQIEAITDDLDIGLVVSNAGSGNPGEFLGIEEAELLQIVRLNVIPHMKLTHHFGQRLAKRGRGGVILVSAMGASEGLPYMANDAATKAYIISLGKGLHTEFNQLGLHLSVLLPGPTDTPVLDKFGFDPSTMPIKPMSVEQCVSEGLSALKANKTIHLTGRMNRWMDRFVPAGITRRILSHMIGKGVASERRYQP